ncbi:MAG: hypothetical protein GY854_35430 [Deltaproteobacteria bacterium]|nr:hypothetical protein [Deltaproteobacteria bacterium]
MEGIETRAGDDMQAYEIEKKTGELELMIGRLESGSGKPSECFAISLQLEELRSQYREYPMSFEGHISTLKTIGERFESWLNSNLSRIVSWYCEINEQLNELESQKAFLRGHFVTSAKRTQSMREVIYEGGANAVRVRSFDSRTLPPAATPERKELEETITQADRWVEVGQINKGRLQNALRKGLFNDEQTALIERLCPKATSYQVSLRQSGVSR